MVKKTRKQKEKAAKRREYLARLAKPPEPKEEIPKKEIPKIKSRLEPGPKQARLPIEYILDFKKALILSGLFIALLIALAFLETKYGFLGPLASRLMERVVR